MAPNYAARPFGLVNIPGVSHPHHSGDAMFVLHLHVNEEAFEDIETRLEVR